MNTQNSNRVSPNHAAAQLPAILQGSNPISGPITRTRKPLSKAERIAKFREQMMRDLRLMPQTDLGQFFARVIADDAVVQAYFSQKILRHGGREHTILPYNLSLKAARVAQGMAILLPGERRVAGLAAFLVPCGLYLCAQQSSQPGQGADKHLASPQEVTGFVLEDGFRMLRGIDPGLSDTLARALNLIDDGDFNVDVTSRIATAAYLVNTNIRLLWAFKA